MKKILEFFSTKVFKQVGDVVDSLFTSEEERLNARNEIFKVLQDAQLELQKCKLRLSWQKLKVIGCKEAGDQY